MIWVPFWWSRGIGGRSAVDYLMRVRDMTFIEAVSQIANDESALCIPLLRFATNGSNEKETIIKKLRSL